MIGTTSAYHFTRTTRTTRSTTPLPITLPRADPSHIAVGRNDPTAPAPSTTLPQPSPPTRPLTIESPTHAALRFLDLDEELFPVVTSEKARALTESISSSRSRERLGELAEANQRQVLAKGDLQGLTLRIAPIATRTRDCTTTACTVDVYFVRLWSFPDKGALDDYATAQINVIMEDNEWRLDSSSLIDGPYPAGRFTERPNASLNAGSFEAALNGFTDKDMTS